MQENGWVDDRKRGAATQRVESVEYEGSGGCQEAGEIRLTLVTTREKHGAQCMAKVVSRESRWRGLSHSNRDCIAPDDRPAAGLREIMVAGGVN